MKNFNNLFLKKSTVFLIVFIFVLSTGFNLSIPTFVKASQGVGNSGAIWTTTGSCGEPQNVNHYNTGDQVFINYSGFNSGSYNWQIKGKPGGASAHPNIVVASGVEVVGSSGSGCFLAYTIGSTDSGEYGVSFGNKKDNYRVNRISDGDDGDDGDGCDNDKCDNEREYGTISICKIILDAEGNIISGISGSTFSISGFDPNNEPSADTDDEPFGTYTFTTPLDLNTNLLGGESNDAECITFDMPVGNYYYSEEIIEGENWLTPKYNEYDFPFLSVNQATFYTPQLFDDNLENDGLRNNNSDGHIPIYITGQHRTLIVVNQMAQDESCVENCDDDEEEICDDGIDNDGDELIDEDCDNGGGENENGGGGTTRRNGTTSGRVSGGEVLGESIADPEVLGETLAATGTESISYLALSSFILFFLVATSRRKKII